MKTTKYRWQSWYLVILLGLVLAGSWPARAIAVTNVFATQFEAAEGYSGAFNLVGQKGWQGQGSGGNGIVTNYIAGQGQQAYIGYSPPEPGDDYVIVWQPLNLVPVPTNTPVIKFTVLMAIMDSTNGEYDDFRWSVYNVQGNPMLTLDFDNYNTNIWYARGADFFYTGKTFARDTTYTLAITMDFAQNRWSAALGGDALVTDQPIAGAGVPLNLGDVDAVWVVYDTNAPGNNYMLFDNYRITAEPPPAMLQTMGWTNVNQFRFRLAGSSGYRYAIEGTTNFAQWTPLKTNTVTSGYFDFIDAAAPGFS
jgi:hypothetical protein